MRRTALLSIMIGSAAVLLVSQQNGRAAGNRRGVNSRPPVGRALSHLTSAAGEVGSTMAVFEWQFARDTWRTGLSSIEQQSDVLDQISREAARAWANSLAKADSEIDAAGRAPLPP